MTTMLQFTKKQWFLLLLGSALAVGYFFATPATWVKKNVGITVLIVPQLFLMSFTLPTRHLVSGLRKLVPISTAYIVSFFVMPLVALALGKMLFSPGNPLALGLLVMAAMPTTLTSNIVWARLAKGNDALSLVITILMTGSCFAVSPVIIGILGPILVNAKVSVEMDTAKLAASLLLKVILPIVLGQAAAKLYRGNTERFRKPVKLFCQALVLLLVWASIGNVSSGLNSRPELAGRGLVAILGFLPITAMFFSVIFIHAFGLATIHMVLRRTKTADPDRKAALITGSQKTLPVSILVIEELSRLDMFKDTNISIAIVSLVAFHACQLLFDTVMISVWDHNGHFSSDDEQQVTELYDTPSG